MSILYIRLPSKAAADAAEHWAALPSSYALASNSGAVEKEGSAPLADLAGMVAGADRTVLLLAASDVSFLRVKTPPLSPAKLKLALPNLVEDQLMMDPSECVVVPGDLADDLRTAIVAQRGWLEILVRTFTGYGAKNVAVVPSQSCLPFDENAATALVTEHGADLDLALRLAPQEALGLPIYAVDTEAPKEVFSAIAALTPGRSLILYVPQARVPAFQDEAARHAVEGLEIQVYADNWPRVIGQLGKTPLNLATALGGVGARQVEWRQWRWPVVLAALLILVNAVGLNVEWFRMKREAKSLHDGMVQIYRSAFPNDTTILDPLAQMKKKVADAERDSGKSSPDDFSQLAGNFAEVLGDALRSSRAPKPANEVISSIEYRDHSLLVHVKSDNPVSIDKIKFGLSARNLSVTTPQAGVWQIRSGK
ncbi:MAG TPA: type II secretion system protein GspL [Burkholderiaceae bacterium]